jgi:hypothetical protein
LPNYIIQRDLFRERVWSCKKGANPRLVLEIHERRSLLLVARLLKYLAKHFVENLGLVAERSFMERTIAVLPFLKRQ